MKKENSQERLGVSNNEENPAKKLGERIKNIRIQAGLTQEQFAETLGMGNTNLSEIENGNVNPKLSFFFNLVKTYNISLDYLFLGIGSPQLPKEKSKPITEIKEVKDIITPQDFYWFMEHSSIFRDTMMGYGAKFLYDNEDIIKRNIRKLMENQQEDNLRGHNGNTNQE